MLQCNSENAFVVCTTIFLVVGKVCKNSFLGECINS